MITASTIWVKNDSSGEVNGSDGGKKLLLLTPICPAEKTANWMGCVKFVVETACLYDL